LSKTREGGRRQETGDRRQETGDRRQEASMALPPAETFEDLLVWRKSHQLTLKVYKLTAGFPKHEIYGLSSQMRRAAV
jgi:hypothetical protein